MLSKLSTSIHNQIEAHQKRTSLLSIILLLCAISYRNVAANLCTYFCLFVCYISFGTLLSVVRQGCFWSWTVNFIWSNKKQQQQTQKQDHSIVNVYFLASQLLHLLPKLARLSHFMYLLLITCLKHLQDENLVPLPQSACLQKCCSFVLIWFFKLLLLLFYFYLSGYFLRRLRSLLVYSGKFHAEI